MKKELMFIFYHMGISKYALGQMYRFLDVSDLMDVLQGEYLFYSLNSINFTEKDIDILNMNKKSDGIKHEAEQILLKIKNEKCALIYYYDDDYPINLRNIPNPPFFILVRGDYTILNSEKIVSIVGSRHISSITKKSINNRVKELVARDFVTVSGLAFGTDIAVHRDTYNHGGKTVAVLPSSIFSIQPKAHEEDVKKILSNGGAVISEYYKEDQYSKVRYIDRNRIISGLSKYIILTEFEEKSGTMHTARFAWKQKRKIFCFNNLSSGIQKVINSNEGTVYEGADSLI
ncbi:DNA-processing protein DprA [Enterococcus casseliflavus]|uniref:DNA-processing protein DprA n=1 Tax=Enterococcus casseliflavus TaxID=37734 RepID=UPI002DB61FFF|nr:DNA-processing protein DprA [Enterococcus casseliflavus]MEB6148238.1 DNA-protecting protein DprA [Enterococcus casseliflavus]